MRKKEIIELSDDEFQKRYASLPRDQKIEIFCHTNGHRQRATFGVKDEGRGFDPSQKRSFLSSGISSILGIFRGVLQGEGFDLDLKFRTGKGKKGTMAILKVFKKE